MNSEKTGWRSKPACQMCKIKKARCHRTGNLCERWTSRVEKTRSRRKSKKQRTTAPTPTPKNWPSPSHTSEDTWAETIDEHSKASTWYNSLVESWRARMNLEHQIDPRLWIWTSEQSSLSNTYSSHDARDEDDEGYPAWLYKSAESEYAEDDMTPEPITRSPPQVTQQAADGPPEASRAQGELVGALMQWGLLQRHDLALLSDTDKSSVDTGDISLEHQTNSPLSPASSIASYSIWYDGNSDVSGCAPSPASCTGNDLLDGEPSTPVLKLEDVLDMDGDGLLI